MILEKNRCFDYIVDENIKNFIDQFEWATNPLGYVRGQITTGLRMWQHHLVLFLNDINIKGFEADHINRNPKDNRFINLRLANRKLQGFNRGNFKKSSSLPKGISDASYKNKTNPFQTSIRIDGKLQQLGYFPTIELAVHAYETAVEFETKKQLNLIQEKYNSNISSIR